MPSKFSLKYFTLVWQFLLTTTTVIYKIVCKLIVYFLFFKQRLYIFSQKLSNENKQRLYKIQNRPTSLFYHVLLIKHNECR